MRRGMLACLLLAACRPGAGAKILEPARDLEVRAGDSLRFLVRPVEGRALELRRAGAPVTGPQAFGGPGPDTVALVDAAAPGRPLDRRVVRVVPRPAPGNFALRFHGNGRDDGDRLKIRVDGGDAPMPPAGADIGAGDFTIEFWVRAEAGRNATAAVECGPNVAWIGGNILLDRDRYDAGRKFGLSIAAGRPVFGASGERGHRSICADRRIDDGAWHHVAVTRAGPRLRLFVDGRLAAAADDGPEGDLSYPDGAVPGDFCRGPCVRSDPFLVLGAEKHDVGPDYPAFRGDVDELRLSTAVRYAADFTVPAHAFRPDAATAALYHFDEGAGHLVHDALGTSPGLLHLGGTPPGPAWIPSDAPTAPAP